MKLQLNLLLQLYHKENHRYMHLLLFLLAEMKKSTIITLHFFTFSQSTFTIKLMDDEIFIETAPNRSEPQSEAPGSRHQNLTVPLLKKRHLTNKEPEALCQRDTQTLHLTLPVTIKETEEALRRAVTDNLKLNICMQFNQIQLSSVIKTKTKD